jgi:mersacidin/lichenicidin family type 2 lantibiotic
MNKDQIIRAWKSETYRSSLTAEQLAALPSNPAGMVELGNDELGAAAGGNSTETLVSFGCCPTGFISWFVSCNVDCGGTAPVKVVEDMY